MLRLRPSPPMDNGRIKCVQFLRFLAATLVVLYHTDLKLFRLSDGAHVNSAAFGAAGTDLLFVISGFIIVFISHGKIVGTGEFVLKRIARIVPLYWLLTLLMLVAFLASPTLFNTTAFDPAHFFASLALVPYPHPVLGVQQPFLVPGWALNYFMFFYLLFGLFLFLPTTQRIATVGLILGALALLRFLFLGADPALDFYGAPIVLDFVLGMLVAWAYLRYSSVSVATIALVLAASIMTFAAGLVHGVSGGYERLTYWGLSDTGLLFACLFIEKGWGWRNWGLSPLGEASFATYLSHAFTLALVAKAVQFTELFPVLGLVGTQSLLVVSALVVGLLINSLVERPLHSFVLRNGDRLLNRTRRIVQTASTGLKSRERGS